MAYPPPSPQHGIPAKNSLHHVIVVTSNQSSGTDTAIGHGRNDGGTDREIPWSQSPYIETRALPELVRTELLLTRTTPNDEK